MKYGFYVLLVASLTVPVAYAQSFGSQQYCDQLADIGANAYDTKKAGQPMNTVMSKVGYILGDDRQKKDAAQGVIAAIYGDSSIRNRQQAYSNVYSACKR